MAILGLASGLAGSAALTALHQAGQRAFWDAPRMDRLGGRAIKKSLRRLGYSPPRGHNLFLTSLAMDLASNGLTYALSARGWKRGGLVGALLGVGAVVLPHRLGLGRAPSRLTTRTRWLTVGYYAFGGVVSGLVRSALQRGVPRRPGEFAPPSPS